MHNMTFNELQRMLKFGWMFCEDCRRKIMVEESVDFKCPECAFLSRNKNRTKTQLECKTQKSLLDYTTNRIVSQPERFADVIEV